MEICINQNHINYPTPSSIVLIYNPIRIGMFNAPILEWFVQYIFLQETCYV